MKLAPAIRLRLGSSLAMASLSALLCASTVHCQTPAPPPPQEVSHQIPPISQLTVAAIAQARQAGHDQGSIAQGAGSTVRARLTSGGSDYILLDTSGTAEAPRRMLPPAPGGAVAFLMKVAMPTQAVSSGPAHTYYVLATASQTRIAFWSCYEDMPGDQELVRRMVAVLSKLDRPFADFDPAFVASAADGPAKYMLK